MVVERHDPFEMARLGRLVLPAEVSMRCPPVLQQDPQLVAMIDLPNLCTYITIQVYRLEFTQNVAPYETIILFNWNYRHFFMETDLCEAGVASTAAGTTLLEHFVDFAEKLSSALSE